MIGLNHGLQATNRLEHKNKQRLKPFGTKFLPINKWLGVVTDRLLRTRPGIQVPCQLTDEKHGPFCSFLQNWCDSPTLLESIVKISSRWCWSVQSNITTLIVATPNWHETLKVNGLELSKLIASPWRLVAQQLASFWYNVEHHWLIEHNVGPRVKSLGKIHSTEFSSINPPGMTRSFLKGNDMPL